MQSKDEFIRQVAGLADRDVFLEQVRNGDRNATVQAIRERFGLNPLEAEDAFLLLWQLTTPFGPNDRLQELLDQILREPGDRSP